MTIAQNYQTLLEQIRVAAERAGRDPQRVSLVAVSKGESVEAIFEAYDAGCRDFGENRVQEALEKMEVCPPDIRWHFIGKLQKNKVNKVIGRFALIHSVDSLELAEKISSSSLRAGVKTPILLESNTSGEETKSGLHPDEWFAVFPSLVQFEGIAILGLMTMAPLTQDETVIRIAFSKLRELSEEMERVSKKPFAVLSMGMSHDYQIAVQEGATVVRIGSALFSYK